MKSKILAAVASVFAVALPASAAPVTGWVVGLDNAAHVSLTGAETASPTLGDGTAENAKNTSIYAVFPSVTLAVGDILTLSGTFELTTAVGLAPTARAAEFRWGLFDVNNSLNVNGWLGYYASSDSAAATAGVRRRNSPNNAGYYSSTGTTLLYANSLVDNTKIFEDATYSLTLSLQRTSSGILLSSTLANSLGYAFNPQSYEDTAANTFTFNRVGFLSGGNLNVDQLKFGDLAVTLTQVPEPGAGVLLLLGVLALARKGLQGAGSAVSRVTRA